MRRYVGWSGARAVPAVLLLGAVALTSCGGGTNDTDSGPGPRTPQFVLDPAGTASNAGTLTMGVSADGLDANRADRITVFAQLLDPDRRPLSGVQVTFLADFPDASFLPSNASELSQAGFPSGATFTDGSGIARITLVAPSSPGRMAVIAETSRNLRLGGLIFVNVFDVGFIPTEGDGLVLLPAEFAITDPSAGSSVQFVVVGGIPFTDQNPPPAGASSDLGGGAQVTPPYLLQNAVTGIGSAELLFDGRFPAVIDYAISGRVGGAHTFGIIDSQGHQASGTVTVEFTPLEIAPPSATLEVGQSQSFILSGGVPPYECVPSGGTISPSTVTRRGGSFTFFPNDIPRAGTFTVVCSDQAGQVASATISIVPLPTPSGGAEATPTPALGASRVTLDAVPPSLNGPQGGASTVTATVLDSSFEPLPGIPLIWSLRGPSGAPTASVPSLSESTGISGGGGQASVILTVPPGTAPQFLVVEAETDNGKRGTVQVGITSQTTVPGGEPASISSALLRQDGCQNNQDGTLTAILSALVIDESGNPVATGVQVDWDMVSPAGSAVVSPSFTDADAPCNVTQYRAGCSESGVLLTISPQPGTAITCFTFAANRAGQSARVRATVADSQISTTTNFELPSPPMAPTPTPTPSPPPPNPTPSPGLPSVVPSSATLDVGQAQTFAISGGLPPYSVAASGGTATPTTIPASGGTFDYAPTVPGNFTIIVSDSNGKVATAQVSNVIGSAIQVNRPGPLNVPLSAVQEITITGGGTAPYTVTVTGGLGGSITGSPLPAPGSFAYDAPGAPTQGQILITDSAQPPNIRSIAVAVP